MFHSIQTVQGTKTARFGRGSTIIRADRPLTEDQIAASCPAVFAQDKHESRSARYTYIPTIEVMRGLAREGFHPFEVRNGGSADEVKRAHTKHLIRFRHADARVAPNGDSFREVVLVNSHDGTGSYQLMSGMFRMICANGLITCDGDADLFRIKHKGDIVQNVIDAAYTIVDRGAEIDRRVADMRTIDLAPAEQEAFAEAAMELRFTGTDEAGNRTPAPVTARQVNAARRRDDAGNSLWLAFNRTQENLVRGGLDYTHRNPATGNVQRRQTAEVRGLDGNTSLNRALWVLAARMQELKGV